MYKNLINEMEKLGLDVKKGFKFLDHYRQSDTTQIVFGKNQFNDQDKKDVYNFLKKKGYKRDLDYLFVYSDPEKKSETRTSKILNQRLLDLKISEKTFKDYIKNKFPDISRNTPNNWLNGTIGKISDDKHFLSVCEYLDISPYYLLGDDRYKNDGYNKVLADTKKSYDVKLDSILSSLLNYFITVDDRYSIFNDNKEMKRFIDANREEMYHNLLPTIKKYFDEAYFNNYDPINNDKSRRIRSLIPKNKKDTYNRKIEYVIVAPDEISKTTCAIPINTAKKLADKGLLDFSKKEKIEDQGNVYYKIISPQFFIDNNINIDAPKKSKKGK